MFLRHTTRRQDGKVHRYRRLVRSVRVGRKVVQAPRPDPAYCRKKTPIGRVEAINGNIRAPLRRGRGHRGHEYLLLKVQKDRRSMRAA